MLGLQRPNFFMHYVKDHDVSKCGLTKEFIDHVTFQINTLEALEITSRFRDKDCDTIRQLCPILKNNLNNLDELVNRHIIRHVAFAPLWGTNDMDKDLSLVYPCKLISDQGDTFFDLLRKISNLYIVFNLSEGDIRRCISENLKGKDLEFYNEVKHNNLSSIVTLFREKFDNFPTMHTYLKSVKLPIVACDNNHLRLRNTIKQIIFMLKLAYSDDLRFESAQIKRVLDTYIIEEIIEVWPKFFDMLDYGLGKAKTCTMFSRKPNCIDLAFFVYPEQFLNAKGLVKTNIQSEEPDFIQAFKTQLHISKLGTNFIIKNNDLA